MAEITTRNPRRGKLTVNLLAFSCGTFGIVLLTKLASYLTPYKLYFSFSSFLYSHNSLYKWEALAIKLSIPCAIGFLLFYIPFYWMVWTQGSRLNSRIIYRYLSRQSDTTAKSTGFFAALLLAWPFIVYWDVLMDPTMLHLKLPFLFVYFLYFVSYAYLAGLGVNLARLALYRRLPKASTEGLDQRLELIESLRVSMMGVLTSGIATYLASVLGPG